SRTPARGRHGPWHPITEAVRPIDRTGDRRVALGSSRDLWRGRLEQKDPSRPRGNDSETRSWSRGIPEGRRGGFRWVGPGYGAAPRPVEVRTRTGGDRRADFFPQRREWGGEDTAPPRRVARGK